MGKVGDHGAVHLEVDLDRGPAQFGMCGGAGMGVGEAAQAGDIAGQFDNSLVVDVVQHRSRSSASGRSRPWRPRYTVLYMYCCGGNTVWPLHPRERGLDPFANLVVRILGLTRPAAC